MAIREQKVHGQRWRLLVGSVALGAAALGLSSCGFAASTAATDEATVEHGGRGVHQRDRHAGRRPDVGAVVAQGARRRAARRPRGLHRADGLTRPVRRAARTWGRRGSPGAGWETSARGLTSGRSLCSPSIAPAQSRSMTVTGSPASTPSPSGSSARPLAAALAASALLACAPHAARDVATVVVRRRRRGRGGACRRTRRRIGVGGGRRDLRPERLGRGPSSAAARAGRRARSSRATTPGCPGSPNTGVPASMPNASGFAGLIATWHQSTRDAPTSSARCARARAHEVVVADRHAAARDHRVARVDRVGERARHRRRPRRRARCRGRPARSRRRASMREEHRPVRVADLARRERTGPSTQLVAGREHADARTRVRTDTRRGAEAGEHAEVRRAEHGARLEHDVAGLEVAAGAAHVVARARPRA